MNARNEGIIKSTNSVSSEEEDTIILLEGTEETCEFVNPLFLQVLSCGHLRRQLTCYQAVAHQVRCRPSFHEDVCFVNQENSTPAPGSFEAPCQVLFHAYWVGANIARSQDHQGPSGECCNTFWDGILASALDKVETEAHLPCTSCQPQASRAGERSSRYPCLSRSPRTTCLGSWAPRAFPWRHGSSRTCKTHGRTSLPTTKTLN